MSRKPVPVLFMSVMLVFVLASAGVAYGLWSQTLQILGSVATGQLDVQWVLDPVSSPACSFDPVADPTVVHVDIVDGVPGDPDSMGTCFLKLVNNGNIPVKILSDDPEVQPAGTWTIADGSNYFPGAPAYTNGGEVYLNYINGVGLTLLPGGETATRLDFSIEDGAAQDATYSFIVPVVVEQVP